MASPARRPQRPSLGIPATEAALPTAAPSAQSSAQSSAQLGMHAGSGDVGLMHGHLWRLADGTGLHAPYGQLVRHPDTGHLCCHLCGNWFVSLAAHVRVHGYTARAYRDALGLLSSRGLVTTELSRRISNRQRAAYRSTPAVRGRLASGQAMARSGELARARRASADAGPEPAQRVQLRSTLLADGRRHATQNREAAQSARMAELGVEDLLSYLRSRYAAGASLQTLAAATGLGRVRLREALTEAGVTVRPPGVNTAAGKASRAQTADARAADRLGVEDLQRWLWERHRDGWSDQRLGRAVGHSGHWVRWRLDAARQRLDPAPPDTPTAPTDPPTRRSEPSHSSEQLLRSSR